jgi:hypothetical protein
MLENSDLDLTAIIAVGLGANKGFWMIQPRDDGGQWIEMGADVLFRVRISQDGRLVVATVRGVYVGPAGKIGKARILVQGQDADGIPSGVYTSIESSNLKQFQAILPDEALKGIEGGQQDRKDIFGKPVKTLEDSKLPELSKLEVADITDNDLRLAQGELTDDERQAQDAARTDSPIATLPVGAELEDPDAVKQMLKDAGIELPGDTDVEVDSLPKPDASGPDRKYGENTSARLDTLRKITEATLALHRESDGPSVKRTLPFDLEVGDVVVDDNGDERTVTNINFDEQAMVTLQSSDGTSETISVPNNQKLNVASGKKGTVSKPKPPRARTPNTTRDDAPSAPPADAPEAVTPEVDAPEDTVPPRPDSGELDSGDFTEVRSQLTPPNYPPKDRLDDGTNFDLPVLSNEEVDAARAMELTPLADFDGTTAMYLDENNELANAEDPFAMMAALAKVYPDAKFTPDGTLILHRQEDKDGKIFELRANNSGKRAIIYSMRFTDPKTGEWQEFMHKDDRHSIASLFRKDNSPQELLDRLLGRVDNQGNDWANMKFGSSKFKPTDSLFKRSKWFRSGTGDRKKMEEIKDNAIRLALGRSAVLAKNGTVKNSEIPSLWDAFRDYRSDIANGVEKKQAADNLYYVLYGVFGRMPLDKTSHALARRALRDEFARQFPERSAKETRSFNGIVSSASNRLRGIYQASDPQVRSLRYASKDRSRVLENGMTVEYTNNVGEKSTVKVNSMVENLNARPNDTTSYNYGDYVIITDADGKKRKINAIKLRILKDQNSRLTPYTANLYGEALRQKRRELGLISTPEQEGPQADAPVGVGTVLSTPAAMPRLVDDFIEGEMLYSRDGRPLGIIKSTKDVVSRDGAAGIAFVFTKPDGTDGTVAYTLGTEVVPKKA